MKKLITLSLALVLAAVLPAFATHPGAARPSDLQRLQDELVNLDEAIAALDPGNARYQEFQDRADEIQDDVVWLKVQMRRHQRNSQEGLGATAREVDDLRRQISTLRADIETAYNWRTTSGTIPTGTDINVRLEDSISSKTARVEDRFEGSVVQSVRVNDRILIPAGSRVTGTVRMVEPAERPAKGGKLELAFETLWLDDSRRIDLRSRVVALSENMDRSGSAKKATYGALLGGVLGKIIGGTKGALMGVLIGGGGGVLTSKGDEVELPAGTILTLRLEQPLTIGR